MQQPHWESKDFEREITAWIDRLRDDPTVPTAVSLEFSNWTLRKGGGGGYLVCRRPLADEGIDVEIHVVFSVNHSCPMLMMRSPRTDGYVPTLGDGFIGGLEYHPHLDQVFYSIHACDTQSWMQPLKDPAPGVPLLSWWGVMCNRALGIKMDPRLFAMAKECLERPR